MVLDAVLARQDHPTADQLYLDVRALDPKISRATVYRNLKILAEQGLIRHLNVAGVERFDWRPGRHTHVICSRCGALSDAPLAYDVGLDQLLEQQTGYLIRSHQTVFEGYCPACQSSLPEAPPAEPAGGRGPKDFARD